MSVDDISTFLAICAIGAEFFVAFSVACYLIGRFGIPAPKNILADIRVTIGPSALWLATIVAGISMAGSLYFSEVAHFVPCNLCWYQRIAMYPLFFLLLQAAWRRDFPIKTYVIAEAAIGGCISIYHVLVEHNIIHESTKVCGVVTSCNAIWVKKFGYLTIPTMALSAFALLIVLMLYSRESVIEQSN